MATFWNRWINRTRSRRKNVKRPSQRRRALAENLETRQLLAANIFHNELLPEDVNEDGVVSALDALTIINQMNRQSANGSGQGVQSGNDFNREPGRMTDVNNDGRDSALDALMVINRLSREQERFDPLSRNPGNPNETPTDEQPTDDLNSDATTTEDTTDDELETDDSVTVGNPTAEDTPVSEASSDPVLFWNDVFGAVLGDSLENQNPGYASRSAAILNLAIFDSVAIASGNTEGTFYDYDSDIANATDDLSAEAVATAAAYTALSGLYPDQQAQLDDAFEQSLTVFSSSDDLSASLLLGEEIANEILALRVDDGSDLTSEYTYTDEVGYFQPDPLNPDVPAWGTAWRDVDTFSISSTEPFVPDTTPALTSDEYAASYNEVLALGSVDSTERTAEETEIGIFWAYDREGLGTPIALYTDVLESVATQEGNTFEENVALFAQASVAMADAAIVAWETKFSEEFWRPITAIQQGDDDGNPLTEGDTQWTALGAPDGGDDIVGFTPQFPTYISGHATFGGALFGTLQDFYGTDDISFEVTSEELEVLLDNPELQDAYGLDLDDATRTFDSFSEAMAENGRSRVYLGIHFDFDDLVGQEVGQTIAASVAADFDALTEISDTPDSGETSFVVSGTVVDATDSDEWPSNPRSIISDHDLTLLAMDQSNLRGDQHPAADNGRLDEGVSGVTVELLDSSGNVVAETVTDDRGRYVFDSIADAGAYQAHIVVAELWMVLGDDTQDIVLTNDHDRLGGVNFRVSLV
ncbi:dockerin type I domain-containing protein [Rubripirellula amarantea]|nr:dockerin type I domain-containing protein [Rubripirellula amarantea]